MGQAFDRDGRVLGEAEGDTMREVLEKLQRAHPDAHELRIRSMREKVEAMERGIAASIVDQSKATPRG